MAHFWGKLQGRGKSPVTVCGDTKTGIHVDINGWEKGIRVVARHNDELKVDEFYVYETNGSSQEEKLVLVYTSVQTSKHCEMYITEVKGSS
jgi:hypothetical protein